MSYPYEMELDLLMAKERKTRIFMGDFETTVYKGQVRTDVWAAACVELYTEDVHIFHSIGEQFDYFKSMGENIVVYYHNLKFDGAFWISYLLTELEYEQAYIKLDDEGAQVEWLPVKDMKVNSFKYSISDMGQWYSITVKLPHNKTLQIRDSLKLLPFAVKRIGQSFGTKHQKLDMEYEGFRYPGCVITEDEQRYIANDVLVVKEALEIMFNEGHNKLTIGSCCLAEYKNIIGAWEYPEMFPNLYEIPLDEKYRYPTVGAWVRASYHGGWCYLVKGKEGKIFNGGITADVNSLYPSMMSSESGNKYPIGRPIFWQGDYIPAQALREDAYYFVRIRTRFYLRPGYLPCIQIKNNLMYKGTEWLTTSDLYNPRTKQYNDKYIEVATGNIKEASVELTLTMTDYELIKEHYELVNCQILDGCYFHAEVGIFDEYIEKYKKIKLENKGAKRELAKLFLNNLYGKMASNQNSSFKVAYLKEDKSVGFYQVMENDKEPGYIPVGSAITSYARNFTIRAAQKNYYGEENPGFIYADTDSIHCDLKATELNGIRVNDKNFCCWKLEATWDEAIFTRQKTYIEHVVEENLVPISTPFYNIKCAGMPEKCKQLFLRSMIGPPPTDDEQLSDEEREFLSVTRQLTDFNVGLKVPGKLRPMRIPGGVLLVETPYEMR